MISFSKLLLLPILSIMLLVFGIFMLPAILMYQMLYIVGFVFLGVGSWLIPFFWYKRVPKVARQLEEAARKKLPILIVAHDTGRTAITTIQEYLGEGIVKTRQGLYKILPQFAPLTTGEEKKGNPGKAEVEFFEKDYRDFITKRSILTGIDVPVFFAYSGKLCALNPEALALYEAGQMQVKTWDGQYVSLEPTEDDKRWREVKTKGLKRLLQPLLLLDIKKIKDLIQRQFDVTQIAAIISDSEQIGRLGRPSLSKYALPLMFILMVVVIGGILIVMGPQLLQGIGAGV